MTATVTDPVALHPVEVDLLCTLAEVPPPFPLRIQSFGHTHTQRREIFGTARAQLAARGLAGNRGPEGIAATFTQLLRSCDGTVDLVVADHGRNLGAVAMLRGEHALLITQSPDDADGIVRMAQVHTDTAVRELLALIPGAPAGSVPAFTVPLPPVRAVFERLARRRRTHGDDAASLSDTDMDGLLWESGVDDRTVSRLTTTMRQVTGSGQFGAATWRPLPGRWDRTGTEVRWVDAALGRFRLSESADAKWASVNPFSRTDARAELRRLAELVRGADDDMGGVIDYD